MSFFPGFYSGVLISVRARYFLFFGISLLVVFVSAFLSSMFSGRQPATIALDVGFSVMRLALPLIIVLLVQELFCREFDRKYFMSSLAVPLARSRFLISRVFSIVFLVLLLLLCMSFVLSFSVGVIDSGYVQATKVSLGRNFWLAVSFIYVECLVFIMLAVFLSIVSTSQAFVFLGVFSFMLVGRSYVSVIRLLNGDASLVADSDSYIFGLELLAYFIPDLSSLDVRAIALYGDMKFLSAGWFFSLSASCFYMFFLLLVALRSFQKKRFQ